MRLLKVRPDNRVPAQDVGPRVHLFEVRRPDTSPDPAEVVQFLGLDRAEHGLEGKAVGFHLARTIPEPAVAPGRASGPEPTQPEVRALRRNRSAFVDLFPEALQRRLPSLPTAPKVVIVVH